MKNMSAILEAAGGPRRGACARAAIGASGTPMIDIWLVAGSSFDKVVKTTILLADMGDFAAVNEASQLVYTKRF